MMHVQSYCVILVLFVQPCVLGLFAMISRTLCSEFWANHAEYFALQWPSRHHAIKSQIRSENLTFLLVQRYLTQFLLDLENDNWMLVKVLWTIKWQIQKFKHRFVILSLSHTHYTHSLSFFLFHTHSIKNPSLLLYCLFIGISGRNCDQCARGYKQYHPLSQVRNDW